MHQVVLPGIGTVSAWRDRARHLLAAEIPGSDVVWQVEGSNEAQDLFLHANTAISPPIRQVRFGKAVLDSVETALHHNDPQRFARAYDILLRLLDGKVRWGDRSDAALHRLLQQEKAVRRDIHKMHAFVRFREVGARDAPRRAFAAWFEPDHPIVEAAAPFFARRFGDMDWVIATPQLTAHFVQGVLRFSPTESDFRPPADATEDLWRTYFSSIFNPARLMVSAMTSEMPRKYWKNLPEAALIPELIRTAPARARAMQEAAPTIPKPHVVRLRPVRSPIPTGLTLDTIKPALDACRRCPIGACASQAVAGEGPPDARLMIVGEQPGDSEDLTGRPFVGPAGQILDQCAAVEGLDRKSVFLTNAVKHFKFSPRCKRRLHQRPTSDEIEHCRWWLDLERQLVRPRLVLGLGATAAECLTGDGSAILQRRGKVENMPDGSKVLISLHPSYILRLTDSTAQQDAKALLAEDLIKALAIANA